MNSSLRTQALTEGALMAAFTALLSLMGIYLPFFKVIIDLFWTAPIIIVIVRHGILAGFLSTGLAGLLLLMFTNPVTSFILVLQFGGLALFYGTALKKGLKPGLTVLTGTVIVLIAILLMFFITYSLLEVGTVNISKAVQQNIDTTIELYRDMGFLNLSQNGITEEEIRQMLQSFYRSMLLLIPSVLVIWALATAFINYMVVHKLLTRLKLAAPTLRAFREWQLPWWVIWGFILGFAVYIAGDRLALEKLLVVGKNIMLVYVPILFVLGLAVITFKIGRYFEGRGFRIFAIIIGLLFFRFVCAALVVTGLLDLVFNYRHLPSKA